ncbi:hypothetical protein LOS25_17490 [Enterococcus faecium]|nr:hypothetical protein [Enterococcus faecium]
MMTNLAQLFQRQLKILQFDSLIIYLDETESEVATDVHVVEDKNDSLKINSSDTLLRVSPIFSAVI